MYIPAELSKGGRVHLAIDQEHQKHGEYQVLTTELQLSDPLLRQRGSSSTQRNIPPVRPLLDNIIRPSVRRQADDDQERGLIIRVALRTLTHRNQARLSKAQPDEEEPC